MSASASTSASAPAGLDDKPQEHKENKSAAAVGGGGSALSLDDSSCGSCKLKLQSKEKKDFEIEAKYACISNLVKTARETDSTADEVPIPGVKSDTLAKVVEYMNYHKGVEPDIIEKPLRSKVMKEVTKTAFDATFIDELGDTNRQPLYDFILACNYMDIKGGLHLGCAKVASLIKGQPLEKIKEILSKGVDPATLAKAEKVMAESEGAKAAAAAAATSTNGSASTTATAAPKSKKEKKESKGEDMDEDD